MADIVIVSMTSWEGNYLKSTVELAKELSARNRVWFLDYQYTLKDFFSGLSGIKKDIPWKQMAGIKSRIRAVEINPGETVQIFTPFPIIPAFWAKSYKLFSRINTINHALVFRPFKRMLRKKGVRPDVVMTSLNPFMGLGVKKHFPDTPHVYYCFDEIRAAHYLKTFGGPAEERLLPQVDGAAFTSDYLLNIKGKDLAKTAVVKNGVHFDAFAKHRRKPGANKPFRVGYLGSIDDRFDIDLMEEVIRQLPDIDFHLVGRIVYQKVPDRLGKYDNVKFFPPVDSREVPPIMGNMDIGIIPYIRNDFTLAVYPLKVNEYLSVGLPVIMTSFADLPDFNEVVDLADDPETFIKCIKDNQANDSEEHIDRRMAFASENSWKKRAEKLEDFLFSVKPL